MKELKKQIIEEDLWHFIKKYTPARIALGRTGVAIPLQEVLTLKLQHALARDAVFSYLDVGQLKEHLERYQLPVVALKTKAIDRNEYLLRPDLGRQLNEASVTLLTVSPKVSYDIVIVVADGLSANAMHQHTIPLLNSLVPLLTDAGYGIFFAIVEQARVAIGDEIATLVNAKSSIVLIGERPGLSSADSMGAYLTYNPNVGTTDESRNCISNIRTEGMAYPSAANKILYLVNKSFELNYSGVALKDEEQQIADLMGKSSTTSAIDG